VKVTISLYSTEQPINQIYKPLTSALLLSKSISNFEGVCRIGQAMLFTARSYSTQRVHMHKKG